MEENKVATFTISKKYLAFAMSFLGFHFYKFNDYKNREVYSFERTEKFDRCFNKLLELKDNYGKY